MPMMPAFCDSCGHAFASGFFVENCMNLSLSGNKSGPCPKCGSMGSVPDGIFNVTRDVIEIVSAPNWTVRRLKDFAEKLKDIRDADASPDEKVDLLKEQAPELESMAEALPRTRGELYAFISMFLFAITIVLGQCSDDDDSPVDQPDFQYVINKAAEDVQSS